MFVKLFTTMLLGSPFQLPMFDPLGIQVMPLDSSLLHIPLGRPAVVGVDRGRGPLHSVTPACDVICESTALFSST